MAGRDLVDQHVCLSIGWPFFDAIDDVVDAFDDLAPLIQGECSFGYIDFGDRHDDSFFVRKYLVTLGIGTPGVKLASRPMRRRSRWPMKPPYFYSRGIGIDRKKEPSSAPDAVRL
jgi:hypothetical protein